MAKSAKSQEGWAAGATGALGVGGAIAGTAIAGAAAGSFAPGIGTVIGAAVGIIAGAITAGVNYGIQEAKENNFENELQSGAMEEVVKAYQTSGEIIFESEQTLAQALGKDVSALTEMEKALLANKNATLELVEEMASYEAQLRATLIQMGTALVGTDATTGEKIKAGEIYQSEYKK
jgi:K+-sensing histidine kinase KdpD